MALMFPWATKEYLLWEMTIGQIVMYHNRAMEIRNGSKPKSALAGKSARELKKMRDEIMNGVAETERQERTRAAMQARYGAI